MFTKTHRVALHPNATQRHYLAKTFGSCRWIYNHLLADAKQKIAGYIIDKSTNPYPNLSHFSLNMLLPLIKKEEDTSWLAEAPAQVLQSAVQHLAQAFSNFKAKRAKFPKFKKKQHAQTAHYPNQSWKIKEGYLVLAKCEIPFRLKRLNGVDLATATNCCIQRTACGKFYAIFTISYVPDRTHGQGVVGVDLGLKTYAVVSDGSSRIAPKPFAACSKQLAHQQRLLSRKKKGSVRYNHQRLKVAKLHTKVKNIRLNFLHNVSARLVHDNQVVCLERLQVKNMVKNRHLAKSLNDVGLGSLRYLVAYKMREANGALLLADPFFPSTQLCSSCGSRPDRKIQLGVSAWMCESCGTYHDRDENASQNLRQLAERTISSVGLDALLGQTTLITRS